MLREAKDERRCALNFIWACSVCTSAESLAQNKSIETPSVAHFLYTSTLSIHRKAAVASEQASRLANIIQVLRHFELEDVAAFKILGPI